MKMMMMHRPGPGDGGLLLLCCCCIILLALRSSVSSSDTDLLLAKVKPALQGGRGHAPNAQLATWNASTPLCLWRGLRWSTLRCDNLSLAARTDPALLLLVSIRLPGAGLAGRLPPDLAAFSTLAALDLADNRLSGPLPASLWNLCDRAITDIRLHGNRLSGAIPAPPGPNTTCDGLRVLDLGANRFSGGFPSFVAAFRGLRTLDLSANRLRGPVPDGTMRQLHLQALNLSYNSFSGQLPRDLPAAAEASSFVGNDPSLCGPPLPRQCSSSSRGVAAVVIGLMAGAVVVCMICWWRRKRDSDPPGPGGRHDDDENDKEERLLVFDGGDHLTLEDVLNATGQVVEKGSYCTVYKAKLASGGGGRIELRLLREGSCKQDAASWVRRIGRARHENLVPLRAFYQGRRGEKLLVYDHVPRAATLHDLLHSSPRSDGQLTCWARRHKIALGAARALAYLHSEGQLGVEAHGNVRSSNVVVDGLFVARLAECALDRLLLPAAAEAAKDGYMAPELLLQRSSSSCSGDVYAFGILLLELLMGRRPSSSDLPAAVKAAVLDEETALEELLDAELTTLTPAELGPLLKLAMGCCAPVPAARPTMAEVVRQLEESCRPNRSPTGAGEAHHV